MKKGKKQGKGSENTGTKRTKFFPVIDWIPQVGQLKRSSSSGRKRRNEKSRFKYDRFEKDFMEV